MAEGWTYRLMLSACRTLYAGVLVWRGSWADAEAELLTALRALEATRPGQAAETVIRLAQLRCRQGRFEDAATLFARTETGPLQMQGGTPSLQGRAELMLEQGDARAAGDLAERYLRAVGSESGLDRAGALELLARARALTGDLAAAQGAASELAELAERVATEPIRGAACLSVGAVAVAQGDPEAARRWFEDAADHYQRGGGAFHAARARMELSNALCGLGREADAMTEARAAYRVFHQLGAVHAAAGAANVLRELGAAVADTVELGSRHLTPREVDVLRLLVRGLSNQLIADELFLSVRTVERHVCNIYDKLDVAGGAARASATAFALSHGLA
jgi:ATP/maltotriose-dependent transcriptional regulator MalT